MWLGNRYVQSCSCIANKWTREGKILFLLISTLFSISSSFYSNYCSMLSKKKGKRRNFACLGIKQWCKYWSCDHWKTQNWNIWLDEFNIISGRCVCCVLYCLLWSQTPSVQKESHLVYSCDNQLNAVFYKPCTVWLKTIWSNVQCAKKNLL